MAKSRQQRRSRLQEQRIANEVGGNVQAGSGSSWRAKSDVRKMGQLRIEAKHTEKDEYKLKLADWLKIKDEAIKGGLETPVMQIEFVFGVRSYKLAVMDYRLFRHWHGFSETVTLVQNEYWVEGKQFGIDWTAARTFFATATCKPAHGVMQVVFDVHDPLGNPIDKHYLAVIEWDLFTALHEAQE